MSKREIDLVRKGGNFKAEKYITEKTPLTVLPAERLKADDRALKELTYYDEPPLREVRCTKQSSVFFGGGDASGRGVGGILILHDGSHYRYGQWKKGVTQISSNDRELLNQVELLVEAEGSGVLEGAEIFCSWILLLQDMHIIRVTIIQKPYLY